MSVELNTYFQQIATDHCPTWVDAWSYGEALLNNGEAAPWHDVGAFVSFHKQLQSLVRSDVVVVEVGKFYEFWMRENASLLAAMAEKRRLGFALRTLLADSAAREAIHELVTAICSSYPGTPVLLALPSPKSWVASANALARKSDEPAVTWENAESASMYVADFLRGFADCDLCGLLLRDNENEGPSEEADALRYQPVTNVASHYSWEVVLDGCADDYLATPDRSIKYCLGGLSSKAEGVKPGKDYWEGDVDCPSLDKQFWYVEIPPDAVPEQVLDKLNALRGSSGN